MNDALMYFLKVNIAIALFYLFYRLVFYNDTFWATRRFYLVFSILLSLVYPFISLSGWLEKQEPMQVILSNYVQLNEITVTPTHVSSLTLENTLLAAYAVVSVVLLVRMLIQLGSVLRWKLKGKKRTLNGVQIIAIDADITPFSFFNSIFINPALQNELETKQILAHENTHARQLHSLDVLLSEILTITCWINPAAWLLRREIRHNLEFLADNFVLHSGFDSKKYQYHLLQLSYQIPENHLINKFNVSPLKKRITRMNQQKSKKAGILKYSLIVPLALALVLSSNAETLVASAKTAISQISNKVVVPQKVNNKNTEDKRIVEDSIQQKEEIGISKDVQSASIDSEKVEQPDNQIIKEQKTIYNQVTIDTTKSESKVEQSNQPGIKKVMINMPEFPGGKKALLEYISKNLRYPVVAQEKGIQGVIIVRFLVNKSGKVEHAEIERGLDPAIDKEGIRVVSSLPDFIPGEHNGKKVSVWYTLPITFKLDNAADKSKNNT